MTGHHSWGYGQADGPSEWHKAYPIAQGNRQSPIDIVSARAVYDPSLKPLDISYESCTSLSISNTGHSVMVEFEDADDRTGETNPGSQLRAACCQGETMFTASITHLILICYFSLKLHLVHWNARKYATFGEAAAAPDGLAVVGVFLEIGKEHASMNRLTDALYMVKFKGTKAQFRGFNPKCLLPLSLDYWTYLGSLTTPPLNESVTWIVLKEPIRISVKQLEKFRTLLFTGEEDQRIQMANNFRPPQPLKGRIVRASFKA
ncbi:CAH7 anhydrase, partial [Mystacornis crossleyi]|nr:CAH7 anhydrase [Mystacornis crossleyi]